MIEPHLGGRLKPPSAERRKRAALAPSLLPASPASWAAAAAVPQMLGNDRFSNCCRVGLANLLVQQAAILGRSLSFRADQVVADYLCAAAGRDVGERETDVLAEAEEHGFIGEQLGAVVAIDPKNLAAARSLCAIFGGLYFGAELPARAQLQLGAGERWDVPGLLEAIDGAGTWIGHASYVAGFSADLSFTVGTWARLQRCTAAWWLKYVDEAYVVVPRAQLIAGPAGQLEQLVAALAAAACEDAAS